MADDGEEPAVLALRRARIAKNLEVLRGLGLDASNPLRAAVKKEDEEQKEADKAKRARRAARKRAPPPPTRRSKRVRGEAAELDGSVVDALASGVDVGDAERRMAARLARAAPEDRMRQALVDAVGEAADAAATDTGDDAGGVGLYLPETEAELDDGEREVFKILRAWRLELSRELGIETYKICQNRTLCELIRLRPTNPRELRAVWGIGPSKVEKFGEAMLKMLEEHGSKLRARPEVSMEDEVVAEDATDDNTPDESAAGAGAADAGAGSGSPAAKDGDATAEPTGSAGAADAGAGSGAQASDSDAAASPARGARGKSPGKSPVSVVVLLACVVLPCSFGAAAAAVPTLDELGGQWLDAANSQRDWPTLNNFWGSVSVAPLIAGPAGTRDVFAVSALESPPFVGCAAAGAASTFGCGRIAVDGELAPAPSRVRWRAYEAARASAATPSGVSVTTRTRMQFEANAVLVDVCVANEGPSAAAPQLSFSLHYPVAALASLGWVFPLPGSNASAYASQPVALAGSSAGFGVVTQVTNASAGAVAIATVVPPAGVRLSFGGEWVNATAVQVPAGSNVSFSVSVAFGGNLMAVAPAAAALGSDAGWRVAFDAAHTEWEQRWQQAFQPGNPHFSGNLPTLSIPTLPAIERVYYASLLTLVSLERTNLPLVAPRVYVTAQGSAWRANGIGGARQWFWDSSLRSLSSTLLDPLAERKDVEAMLSVDFHQANGISLDDVAPPPSARAAGTGQQAGGFYAFNAWAIFLNARSYLAATNDTSLLSAQLPSGGATANASDILESLALDWQNFLRPGTLLADYGPSPDSFLECVPTYIHAVPAVQANNAWMVTELAELRAAQGDASRADALRSLAANVSQQLMRAMFVPSNSSGSPDGGYFACLYPNGTRSVRHIVDFFSVAISLCGRLGCSLSAAERADMAGWLQRESVTATWMRALSPRDELQYIARPDHGTTGAYGAWPALAVEGLAFLQGHWSTATQLLVAIANNTYEGPFGQAHLVPQDPVPPYTPHDGLPAYKPVLGLTRYVADCGGAFADVVVRSLFGYSPAMQWPPAGGGEPAGDVAAQLLRASAPRGFDGRLSNVRTPLGLATITSSDAGLSVAMQAQ